MTTAMKLVVRFVMGFVLAFVTSGVTTYAWSALRHGEGRFDLATMFRVAVILGFLVVFLEAREIRQRHSQHGN